MITEVSNKKSPNRTPWSWVPSLYFAQGIPYVMVMSVSVILYKRLGLSNAEIAYYTSWLYLPWVIKPLWSPFIDLIRTKRFWIVSMQAVVTLGLAGIAFTIPTTQFLQFSLACFWLLAFSSATHDIAADGFYLHGLTEHQQTLFVGIRSTFYRVAMIVGQGVLIIFAGNLEAHSGLKPVDVFIKVDNTSAASYSFEQLNTPANLNVTEQSIRASAGTISIKNGGLNKYTSDSLLGYAKRSNVLNGFYEHSTPKDAEVKLTPGDTAKPGPSVVIFSVSLNKPVSGDSTQVLTFDKESADPSFVVLEGSRLRFNSGNWNKTAYITMQIDPKLKQSSEGHFQIRGGDLHYAWSMTFYLVMALFLAFSLYHAFILPYPATDGNRTPKAGAEIFKEFGKTFASYFKKKQILLTIAFLLIYRFGEAQLIKLAQPFLLDPHSKGGLELSVKDVGIVYGTVGIVALTIGGILGGLFAAKRGLRKSIWWMFLAINLPHLLYVYMAYAQPDNIFIIASCVAGEQLGYGFGFTAYMLYMIYFSEGENKTAHYAISTGFMALSMMLPGYFSGLLQEWMGYQHFFVYILLTMIPGFYITKKLDIDPEFGKKH